MIRNTIEQLNDQITYEEGKIYQVEGIGYTSTLMKRLLSIGWEISCNEKWEYILLDPMKNKVVKDKNFNRLLFKTAQAMR